MPNHVTHRIIVTGPATDVAAFHQRCIVSKSEKDWQGKEQSYVTFDFNALIPMPEGIVGSQSSSSVRDGLAILGRTDIGSFGTSKTLTEMLSWPWVIEAGIKTEETLEAELLKRSPDCVELAKRAISNHEKYGHADWYGWSCANWGTKWGAYSFSDQFNEAAPERYEFKFDTAWSMPTPIFDKLAKEFPTLRFEVFAFDEGWNFAGEGTIEGGFSNVREIAATKELYETVYGEAPETYEEESEDAEG